MSRDYCTDAYRVHSNFDSFHRFQEKFKPIVTAFHDELCMLSCQMVDYFEESMQLDDEFDRKMNLCYQLKNIISKHNPMWLFNVVPTGSTVTGLATSNSDLDVAIHIPQAARILEQMHPELISSEHERIRLWRKMQLEILQIVRLILEKDEQISSRIDPKKGVKLVQAQIQILQIETVDGIECDISVVMEPFLSSMHNSFMIRHFTNIDNRFAPLCAVVKKWAASSGVKNPKDGGFNSYALVILVIHFLQCGAYPPILPNLSKLYRDDNFIAQSDKVYPLRLNFGAPLPRPLPRIMENQSSIAQLFMEFLHYYIRFDFEAHYISMKDSEVKNRNQSMNQNLNNEKQKEVYIEDPFDAHNPGRTVRTLSNIKKILRDTINMFIPNYKENEDRETQRKNFHFPTLHDILYMQPLNSYTDDQDDGAQTESEENGPCTSNASLKKPPKYV